MEFSPNYNNTTVNRSDYPAIVTDFSESFRTFIIVYLLIIISTGIIANSFIILAFACQKRLRTNVNSFPVSLSCSDLIHVLLIMPLEVEILLNDETWKHSLTLCEFYITMYFNVLSSSNICLLLIALYRFTSLSFPYISAVQKPRNIRMVICLAWIYTLVTSSLPILGWNNGPSFIYQGQCFVQITRKWNILFSVCNFFIPAFITLLLYFFIYIIARKHAKAIYKDEARLSYNSDSTARSNKIHQRLKVFRCSRTMLKITTVYLVCWMPFVLLNFIYAVTFPNAPSISRYVHTILLLLAYTNSMLDPLLYAIWCSDFKRVVLKTFHRFES